MDLSIFTLPIMTWEQIFFGIISWLVFVSTLMFVENPKLVRGLEARSILAIFTFFFCVLIKGGYLIFWSFAIGTVWHVWILRSTFRDWVENVLCNFVPDSWRGFLTNWLIVWNVTILMWITQSASGSTFTRLSWFIKFTIIFWLFVIMEDFEHAL